MRDCWYLLGILIEGGIGMVAVGTVEDEQLRCFVELMVNGKVVRMHTCCHTFICVHITPNTCAFIFAPLSRHACMHGLAGITRGAVERQRRTVWQAGRSVQTRGV